MREADFDFVLQLSVIVRTKIIFPYCNRPIRAQPE